MTGNETRWSGQLVALAAALFAILASISPGHALGAFPGANGRIAYVGNLGESGTSIYTILPDGSGLQRLTDAPGFDDDPSWSADGRKLVFSRTLGGPATVITMNTEGGDQTEVVRTPPASPSPSFSPSGRRIVYVNYNRDTREFSIRTIRADGTEPLRLLNAHDYAADDPVYSPSGKRIAFAGQPEGNARQAIWSMRRDGSHLRRLTEPERGVSDAAPDFSPDGRRIVFLRRGEGATVVMRADGSREREIPGLPPSSYGAVYSPAGDRIAAARSMTLSSTSFCSDLFTIAPSGSEPQFLTNNCQQDPTQPPRGGIVLSPSWQPLPSP